MSQNGETKGTVRWSASTHQGRVRRRNEDAFLALRLDSSELSYLGKLGTSPMALFEFIFAVSDGMGGENAGKFASQIILQSLTTILSRDHHHARSSTGHGRPESLERCFQTIHEHARQVSLPYEECRGMGATLSVTWFHDRLLHLAHVGDSRVYSLPANGGIQQLTEDHTVPGRLFREGKLSEREARDHPYRNPLERSIGSHEGRVSPQLMSLDTHPGDTFVICSDGITAGLRDQGIEQLIRQPPSYVAELLPAQRLVREALEASGRDNLTAVVIELGSTDDGSDQPLHR